MHQPRPYKCSICDAEVGDIPMTVLKHQIGHVQVPKMPLADPPPRDSRFGSPLKLSRVHWVRPELVVEVTYLTWTENNLLRQVSYQGEREDKPARQVVQQVPHEERVRK
jgi:ATP-dependent DNA ligase